MKKLFIITLFALACTAGAYAQKTVVRFHDTQTRILEPNSSAYVNPLTVELQVIEGKGRIKDVWPLTKEKIEELRGEIPGIRSYAVFRSAQKHEADVIVAATFEIKSVDEIDRAEYKFGKEVEYMVTVVGYPAEFKNWKTATPEDYVWIRMEKPITTNDRDKIAAIVK